MKIFATIRMRPWLVPTIVFSVLVIGAATMHPLWGDEAETALFARNILTYGVPKGWDGVNIMGINNAVVLDKNLLNHTSPWAQYYMVALSFFVFGQTSFTARIPSILFSIIVLPLTYILAYRLTQNRRIAWVSSIILSVSVPWILFAYQARYYSLATVAGLLLTVAFLSFAKSGKKYALLWAVSAILFFHANYVILSAFTISLAIATLIYIIVSRSTRSFVQTVWQKALIILPLTLLFTLPWFLILKPFENRGAIALPPLPDASEEFIFLFIDALARYNLNNALPILLLPIGMYIMLFNKKDRAGLIFTVCLMLSFFAVMTFFTVIARVDTSFTLSRYTMVILPFLSILVAIILNTIWQRHARLGTLALVFYLSTNIFTWPQENVFTEKVTSEVIRWGHIRSLPWEFVTELFYPYKTPDIVVAQYLKEKAKVGDTAFVNLDRNHEPLIFHLGKKIKFVNRVSLINTRIFPENRAIIPRYIYAFRDSPDWVILYSKRGMDESFFTFDYRPLPPEIDLTRDYEETVLPVFFSDMSRPEIELRSFRGINPNEGDFVYVYKKKSE